jgi:hypothetical protein
MEDYPMSANIISGERFDHKIAAVFASESEALDATERLRRNTRVRDAQIFILNPHDPHTGKSLEPEDKGIRKTLVRSHIGLGLAGAVAGLLLFALLMAIGIAFVVNNAYTTALILLVFGAVAGMMLAGLLSLRPDHEAYLINAREALKEGKFVVAVHAASSEQQQEAEKILDQEADDTTRSL